MRFDYTIDSLRRCLENLAEMQAAVLWTTGRDDHTGRSRIRAVLACIRLDLEKALARLPCLLREAVHFRYQRALSEREAARRLGISQRALQKRLQRAHALILEILSGR